MRISSRASSSARCGPTPRTNSTGVARISAGVGWRVRRLLIERWRRAAHAVIVRRDDRVGRRRVPYERQYDSAMRPTQSRHYKYC